MIDAPKSVLHALFDAAMAVEGSMLALFESKHPEAPEAFRAWCVERGHRLEQVSVVAVARGQYQVIGVKHITEPAMISIHLDGELRKAVA